MAKISTTKKIGVEEFPNEVRSWIGKLVNPVNKFFEQTYFAVSKGLTIADNLKAEKFSLDIAENQVYPMKVTWPLNEKPTAVLLAHLVEVGAGGTLPVHSLQWLYSNGNIEVTLIGLDANKKYKAVIYGQV